MSLTGLPLQSNRAWLGLAWLSSAQPFGAFACRRCLDTVVIIVIATVPFSRLALHERT